MLGGSATSRRWADYSQGSLLTMSSTKVGKRGDYKGEQELKGES